MAKTPAKQRSYRSGGVPYDQPAEPGVARPGEALTDGTSRGPVDDPSAQGGQGQGYAPEGAVQQTPAVHTATYGGPLADQPDLGRGWAEQEGASGFTGNPDVAGAEPAHPVSLAPSAPSVGIAAEPGTTAPEPPAAGDPEVFRGEAAYNQAVREPYGGYQGGYPGEAVTGDGSNSRPDEAGPRFAPEYLAWRAAQLKQLDDDYEVWCRRRQNGFSAEFDAWQRRRSAARRRIDARRPGRDS